MDIEPIDAYGMSSVLDDRISRVERVIGKKGMPDEARIFG